ncbi:MAG: DUF7309 domain-containing protein [Christensenellales bacterium]|jgi:hypothetical protein
MISDKLLDLAFQFKKEKLWKKLYDTELFAVAHADGTVGYCSVMGAMGEFFAIAVYPGAAGMDSFRLMGKDRALMNEPEATETAISQDCVMLSFENKDELREREVHEVRAYCAKKGLTLRGRNAFPRFQRFRPRHIPWYLEDEADQTHLIEALEAAFAVSQRLDLTNPVSLGFAEGAPFDREIPLLRKENGALVWDAIALPQPQPIRYPSPKAHDEIALAKLSKSKSHSGTWLCDVFMHINPMADDAGTDDAFHEPIHAPFYPLVLIIMDSESGMIQRIELSDNTEDDASPFMRAILDLALKIGRPARVLVQNARAHALFETLCAQLGTALVLEESIPMLEDAIREFAEMADRAEDEPDEEAEKLMELLRNPAVYSDMPIEGLLQLRAADEAGVLPKDVAANVRRECEKRGL